LLERPYQLNPGPKPCLNKKVSEISGATVTMTTSNGVVTVVSADPANDHACVYILVGPEKIMG
jgi:hypothetical protein